MDKAGLFLVQISTDLTRTKTAISGEPRKLFHIALCNGLGTGGLFLKLKPQVAI
jgi:hypothetical protein